MALSPFSFVWFGPFNEGVCLSQRLQRCLEVLPLASSLHLSWDASASPQLPPLHLLLSDSLSSGPLTRFPPWVDEKSLALSSFAGKIKISITDVRIFKEQQ